MVPKVLSSEQWKEEKINLYKLSSKLTERTWDFFCGGKGEEKICYYETSPWDQETNVNKFLHTKTTKLFWKFTVSYALKKIKSLVGQVDFAT
jgi:hypothetical protein